MVRKLKETVCTSNEKDSVCPIVSVSNVCQMNILLKLANAKTPKEDTFKLILKMGIK
jgi:hypothetical protein